MKTTITVKWTAFEKSFENLPNQNGNAWSDRPNQTGRIGNAEITFDTEIPPAMFDEEILELLFEQTNLYGGQVWKAHFEGKMPEDRSHTALSVGDQVVIERNDDRSEYVCKDVGWELLTFQSKSYGKVRDVFQLDQDRMMSRMADAEMGDL